MDEAKAARLRKALVKAGLTITPQEYTARKYLIVAVGIALAALCCCLNFLFGAFVAVLGMIFALMKQRDTLDVKIRKKERMAVPRQQLQRDKRAENLHPRGNPGRQLYDHLYGKDARPAGHGTYRLERLPDLDQKRYHYH